MVETFRILALGGDGIGPEVVSNGIRLIEAVSSKHDLNICIEEDLLHGAAWDAYGTFCRDETVSKAKDADALLVGAVGGPKWDAISVPGGPEMQDGLMRLRSELSTYAGLRPARAYPGLDSLTPFRPGLLNGADVMVLREMCGGAFFTQTRGIERDSHGNRRGFDLTEYTSGEVERIAHAGFRLARRRRGNLVSVDKANVMESYVLWREVVSEIAREYPDVSFSNMYADNASYQLMRNPASFDVILGDNLFGDILSDQAGAIAGSLGMLPSACLTSLPMDEGRVCGIYEPVHGSAPDIVGKGIANPVGMLLSVAMMFEFSFGRSDICAQIDRAVSRTVESGCRTPDIGGSATTDDVTNAVIHSLED